MALAPLIDCDSFNRNLALSIGEQLKAAAEPLILKALQDVETHLRLRPAEMVCGMVQTEYNVQRDGRDLRITVKLSGKP